jgi:uncharacterized protein YjbI with pentapeptide repeats
VDLGGLTLPRTLVERSRFYAVSFRDTDLRLSCLSEGEFVDCDFGGAVLTCADFRGNKFFACNFENAGLIGVDLRGAAFEHCDFAGADLTGARLDRALKEVLPLNDIQRARMVDWCSLDDEDRDEKNDE